MLVSICRRFRNRCIISMFSSNRRWFPLSLVFLLSLSIYSPPWKKKNNSHRLYIMISVIWLRVCSYLKRPHKIAATFFFVVSMCLRFYSRFLNNCRLDRVHLQKCWLLFLAPYSLDFVRWQTCLYACSMIPFRNIWNRYFGNWLRWPNVLNLFYFYFQVSAGLLDFATKFFFVARFFFFSFRLLFYYLFFFFLRLTQNALTCVYLVLCCCVAKSDVSIGWSLVHASWV